MPKPRTKTHGELSAEIGQAEKKIRQYGNKEKILDRKPATQKRKERRAAAALGLRNARLGAGAPGASLPHREVLPRSEIWRLCRTGAAAKGIAVHSEAMLPPHAPPSFSERSALWNSVEEIEKSKDAQLAREVETALPVGLSREEQPRLVRGGCPSCFVPKGRLRHFHTPLCMISLNAVDFCCGS